MPSTGPWSRRLSAALGLIVGALASGVGGCTSYAAPGRGADMTVFQAAQALTTDEKIRGAYAAEPLASFPASIAVVRVQGEGYRNYAGYDGYGSGRYSVITRREVEKQEQFDRLAKLPGVAGVAPLGRLLIPERLQNDQELRVAAASLRADLLLIYTFDTQFSSDNYAGPLMVVSLGLLPTKVESVKTTASAVLLDTRTGFVHAVAEGSGDAGQLANAWTSSDAADDARLRAERRAFEALIEEFAGVWPMVLAANESRGAPKVSAAK